MKLYQLVTALVTFSTVFSELISLQNSPDSDLNQTANPILSITTLSSVISDKVLEKSLITTDPIEGSGTDETSNEHKSSLNSHNEISTSTLLSLTHYSNSELRQIKTPIRKRSANFYNGFVGSEFYYPFNINNPQFPPTAMIGMSRALQRGNQMPKVEFVALWNPRGAAPHWGSIYVDESKQIEGSFIQNGLIMNLTHQNMAGASIRLLQYVGSPESNNFRFMWVLARDVDITTVLSQKQSGICSPRMAPAVFQDGNYEFLGEADIDNRTMMYVYQGHVHIVDKAHFLSSVYILTKQRCACSCPAPNLKL